MNIFNKCSAALVASAAMMAGCQGIDESGSAADTSAEEQKARQDFVDSINGLSSINGLVAVNGLSSINGLCSASRPPGISTRREPVRVTG